MLQDFSCEIAPNWEQHVRTLHRAPTSHNQDVTTQEVPEVRGSVGRKETHRLRECMSSKFNLSVQAARPQQDLNFLPLPQGQGSLRPTVF